MRVSRELLGCGMFWMFKKVNIGRKIISGVINCIILMLRFFSLLLIFNVLFCLVFGKKKLMLFILDVKFVFVKLYNRVMSINILKGVVGFCMVNFSQV